MGDIGYGYGSECHLLRWMGRHRKEFDEQVLCQSGLIGSIDWLDMHFDPRRVWPDAEWTGLDFLPSGNSVRRAWEVQWPQSGTQQNWDAVGWLHGPLGQELLLVEAKAHIGELRSDCGAHEASRQKIEGVFARTKSSLGVVSGDWLTGHYQYANRLAMLDFLRAQGLKARLVLIYFYGDRPVTRSDDRWVASESPSVDMPRAQSGWDVAIRDMDTRLGLPRRHALSDLVHHVFLPIAEAK